MPVITGQAEYPKDLIGMMRDFGFEVTVVDGLALAEEAGSAKAVNLVLMGVLSNHFSFPEEAWQEAIDACVPPKVLELNRRAFALGRAIKA
jgi:indolepyruvate ferredoxin oxidoreductase beta subunit